MYVEAREAFPQVGHNEKGPIINIPNRIKKTMRYTISGISSYLISLPPSTTVTPATVARPSSPAPDWSAPWGPLASAAAGPQRRGC